MSSTAKLGFTIIETMLFLAVTGVLIIGILASTGGSINVQRYRDSVTSFKSALEQQFSDVTTVRNETRATNIACSSTAVISDVGATLPRGQSDCVVMGKYMTVVGSDITTSVVVGNTSSSGTPANDIVELQDYSLSVLPTSTETSTLEWGARIAWTKAGIDVKNPTTLRTLSVLVLRSPTSGLVYTFTGDSTESDLPALTLHNMVKPGSVIPGQAERRVCIDSDGGFGGGSSIAIGAMASSANSLQVRTNDMADGTSC